MPPHIHTPSWSWCRRRTVWGSNSGCSPAVHRSRPYRRTPPQGSRPDRLPSPLTGKTSRIQRWGVCGSLTSPRTRTTSWTCSGAVHFAVRVSSPSPGASAPPGPRWYSSWYPPWWLLSPTKIRCGRRSFGSFLCRVSLRSCLLHYSLRVQRSHFGVAGTWTAQRRHLLRLFVLTIRVEAIFTTLVTNCERPTGGGDTSPRSAAGTST